MSEKERYLTVTWEDIKKSGLLAPDRIIRLEAELSERIEPVFNAKGEQFKGVMLARTTDTGGLVYYPDKTDQEWVSRTILSALLTDEEFKLVQDRACFQASLKREAEQFAKAKKIKHTDWHEGVFFGDTFFHSMADCLEHLEENTLDGEPWPEFVWGSQGNSVFEHLHVHDIIDNMIENYGYEDMDTDDANGVDDLEAAVNRFKLANLAVVSYTPDYSSAVLVPQVRSDDKFEVISAAAPE